MKMLGDRVLVVRCRPREKQGLLFVPEVAQGKRFAAKVLATGPEVKFLERGDLVLLPSHGGDELPRQTARTVGADDSEVYLVTRETTILGVVDTLDGVEVA